MSNIHELEHYRYILNENADKLYKRDPNEDYRVAVNTEPLRRQQWTVSYSKKEKLDVYIRTPKNPDGIVDAQIFIPATGQIKKDFNAKLKRVKSYYRKDDLEIMDRDELIEICEALDIEYKRIKNDLLVKRILKATRRNDDD